jgi:hypothetical protein
MRPPAPPSGPGHTRAESVSQVAAPAATQSCQPRKSSDCWGHTKPLHPIAGPPRGKPSAPARPAAQKASAGGIAMGAVFHSGNAAADKASLSRHLAPAAAPSEAVAAFSAREVRAHGGLRGTPAATRAFRWRWPLQPSSREPRLPRYLRAHVVPQAWCRQLHGFGAMSVRKSWMQLDKARRVQVTALRATPP